MNQNDQLKDIIKREYKKSATDAEYFMRKYCIIQHPIRGKINFDLFDYQAKTLNAFLKDDNVIILKARQIGISTLVGGYALWLMLFHQDKNVLVIATKQETAKNIVTKVRVMHDNLPVWLRGSVIEDNKLSLRFKNGSQIKAVSSSPDAGRSEALSLLILDEAAHIDPPELADTIWTAASSTLSTGGKAVILSTPNGMGNFFHKMWVGAKNKENNFFPIVLDWRVHPERDQAWRDKQTRAMGELEARQEHDVDFIASGHTVIPGDTIQFHRTQYCKEPISKQGFDNNLWIWEYPVLGKSYVVVADVARGDASDKSGCHVVELESCIQVAEYKGVLGTTEYGNLLVELATKYHDALLVVENANVGWAVLQQIINRGYRNLFYMEEDLHYVDPKLRQLSNKFHRAEKKSVPGFTTSLRTRPLIISKLDEYMRTNSVTIRSARMYDELEVFVWNGSKAEAMPGYNDDLVLAMCIALWVRDTALKLRMQGIEVARAAINQIGHSTHEALYTPNSMMMDPFQIHLGGPGAPGGAQGVDQTEDLRWLLR